MSKIPVSATAFAISREFEKLQEELEKYARDPSIQGSSVLISGHRGAGKTTLVRLAIDDLSRRLETGFKEPRKLLLVPLHGPDLIDEKKSFHSNENGKGKTENEGEEEGDKQADESENDGASLEDKRIKNILEHITISLYREAANEFVRSFRNRLRDPRPQARQNEQPELLRLELDETPDLQTLRQLWKPHGFLDRGVLFDPDILKTKVEYNAGVQEIATLYSAAQAFRIITGTVTASNKKSNKQITELIRSVEQELITKDIVNGIIGLGSGAVVGAGVLESLPDNDFRLLLSSVVAVATAMFATITIKRSTKSTTNRESTKEYNFIRRTDISSLNRELPNLIKRMREIGLAPIFVVDELDKVIRPDQFESFGKVIAYLKKLVSENSFFCFLTDRQYFDHISGIYQRSEYPEEYTYFTHKFFVQYRPSELHDYLDRYLQFKNIPTKEVKKQAFQLKYLLLNRARLHNMDLRREILKWIHEGSITIDDEIVQGKYRYQIMLQLAIELIMESSELVNRCDQDPDFHQLVSDTLYYPNREWVKGAEYLNVERIPFETYLKKRNAPDEEDNVAPAPTGNTDPLPQPEKPGKTNKQDPGKADKGRNPTISDIDITLLHKNLMKLVALICQPGDLKKILATSKKYSNDPDMREIWNDLVETIPTPTPGSVLNVLLLEKTSESKYRWKFDYFGRPLGKVAPETDATKKVQFIKDVDKAILDATGKQMNLKILAQYRMIHNSPTWDAVKIAIDNLENFSGNSEDNNGLNIEDFSESDEKYPDINADYQNLNEYYAKISARMPFLYYAMVLAWNLKRLTTNSNWIECLSVIPNALDVSMGERAEPIVKLLPNVASSINSLVKPDDFFTKLSIQSILGFPDEKIQIDRERQVDAWWESWRTRLLAFYQTGAKKIDVSIHDLLAMTHKVGFANEFGNDIEKITRETWMKTLVDGYKSVVGISKEAVPVTLSEKSQKSTVNKTNWIMYPALFQLKLDAVVGSIGTKSGAGDLSDWLSVLSKRQPQVPPQRFVILVSKTPLTGPETTSSQYPIVPVLTSLWQTEKETITNLVKIIAESYKETILVVKVDTEDFEKLTGEMVGNFVIKKDYTLVLQLRGDPAPSTTTYGRIENFDQIDKALPAEVKP